MKPYYQEEGVTIYHGDCREFDGSADAIITDPPYGLEFMGKEWDCLWDKRRGTSDSKPRDGGGNWRNAPTYVAGTQAQEWHRQWASHLLGKAGWLFAFGGTRTWHRLACAIEDSGWQIRDTMMWLYGQGFPKGKNNLKPAWEPIIVARKYGDLDIDAARIAGPKGSGVWGTNQVACRSTFNASPENDGYRTEQHPQGRWPANLILDEEAAAMLDEQSGECGGGNASHPINHNPTMGYGGCHVPYTTYSYRDSGGASRFFYCAKASKAERGDGNDHPTVKPLKLMEYLITLSGGQTILDPFMGSGTTLWAAKNLGKKAIGIDIDEHSCEIAANRCRQGVMSLESEGRTK